MNLASSFDQSASAAPTQTAIYWGDSEIAYEQLQRQAHEMAGLLIRRHGIEPGDRVALWMKNRPEFVVAALGVLRAGGVLVPINNFLKPAEAGFIVGDSGARVLITDSDLGVHEPALVQACPDLNVIRADVPGQLEAELPATAWPDRDESDLAVLIYTSGTTGKPKGAMLSHSNLLHNVQSCGQVLEATGNDRMAVILPLFHSYMLTVGMLLPLLIGGSMVLVKSLSPLKQLWEELVTRGATILPGIPQLYRSLVSSPLKGPLPIRIFISGSAPLPVQVLKEFEVKFATPLLEGYGLSEASPVVSKNPLNGVRKAGSIGMPIPGVKMSVQDEQGQHLGPGDAGEICVRGGNVMMGYWNQPDASARAMRNGWLLTGDIGYRDAEGYYFITDRKKDMLLVNGNNVYPREIEEVIHQFAGIKETAVIGVADARRGERPLAFVAPVEGSPMDVEALASFLREKLADYKQPKEIRLVSSLPRNATGKIMKTTLREQVQMESK